MIDANLIKQNIPEIQEDHLPALVELVNNTFSKDLADAETKGFGDGRKDAFNKIDAVVDKHGFKRTSGLTSVHYDDVLTRLKENQMSEDIQKKIQTLEQSNKNLSEQLKTGNPDWEKKEQDFLGKIKLLEGQNKEKEELLNQTKDTNKKELLKLYIANGMPKVKDSFDDVTVKLHKERALDELIKFADFDEDNNVIFRDESGGIRYNAANKNNPFSIDEMWKTNDYFKPIMDEGRQQVGMSSKDKSKQTITFTSISNATNQVEADNTIRQSLLAKGMTMADPKFHEEFTKLRKDNNVEQLPLT